MKWKEVLILDCPEIACPKVLRIVFDEVCGYFRRRGISVRVIGSVEEIHDEAMVWMGDFIHVEDPCRLLASVSTQALYVGWYWHQKKNIKLLPFFLHVYENVLSHTLLPDKVQMLEWMQKQPYHCPLLLRVNEDPQKIGTYPRKKLYDYCFMGGRMCHHLVPCHRYRGVYDGVHDTDLYKKDYERREVYLSSVFALGFQTQDNIQNGHVSQRIFEGMAYGCVVLSNSIHASIQTEGIVEYVEPDREKFAERMDFFLNNPHYIQQKQERGYEFVRRCGTNEYAISLLLEKISTLSENKP